MTLRRYFIGSVFAITAIMSGCSANTSSQTVQHTAEPTIAKHSAPASNRAASAQNKSTHTQPSTPTNYASAVRTIASQIHMFNRSDGVSWGYRGKTFEWFKTTNAGTTWSSVSIPDLPTDRVSETGPGGRDFVYPVILNQNDWWMVWIDADKAHVLKTTDGGASWSRSSFAVPSDVEQIGAAQFVSPRDGWILLLGQEQGGATPKYLFRTRTSDTHWQFVNDSTRGLPHNGSSVVMNFGDNGKMGIIATVDNATDSVVVDETHDAGSHWRMATLSISSSTNSQLPKLLMARAVSPHEFLVVMTDVDSSGNHLIVQSQYDGGKWTSNTEAVGQVQALSSITPDSLVLIERQKNREELMRTIDGGFTWYTSATPLPNNVIGAHLISFDIADPATWYMLFEDNKLVPTLIKTTDGGTQWTQL